MPNVGKEIKIEIKLKKIEEIFKFWQQGKDFVKSYPSFECTSLPKSWEKFVRVLMHYVTLEGRHKVVYAYHFVLLNHFRLKGEEIVNFSFFIMHSLEISINKCKVDWIESLCTNQLLHLSIM